MVDAAHPGVCPNCGERFPVDTPIRRRQVGLPDEGWGHDVCPDPLAAGHPVCPDCFLVHPPGTCDR